MELKNFKKELLNELYRDRELLITTSLLNQDQFNEFLKSLSQEELAIFNFHYRRFHLASELHGCIAKKIVFQLNKNYCQNDLILRNFKNAQLT
jgi:hypothetical protein